LRALWVITVGKASRNYHDWGYYNNWFPCFPNIVFEVMHTQKRQTLRTFKYEPLARVVFHSPKRSGARHIPQTCGRGVCCRMTALRSSLLAVLNLRLSLSVRRRLRRRRVLMSKRSQDSRGGCIHPQGHQRGGCIHPQDSRGGGGGQWQERSRRLLYLFPRHP